MQNIKHKFLGLFAALLLLGFAGPVSAATQTLTILGANGVQGDVDPYTEYSRDNGVTWHQAFLTGWHPWGFLPGTNGWVNFDPSPFVGLNTTTLYRVRFNVPAGATNPTASIQVKADNAADISLNGTFVSHIVGQGTANADVAFANTVHPGMNELTIKLIDWGGWVGFNYRVDLTVQAAAPLSTAPASSSPAGIAAASGNVSRTPWEMNHTGSWINIHGGPVFSAAVTPPVGDPGWTPAPNGETIDLFIPSIIPAPFCRVVVDYTYFQTVVTVPLNMNVSQFNLDFLGRLDDFLRVTVFNSAYPNGVVPPRTTLSYFSPTTGDFANYIVPGENRIVVTLADNCPQTNMVRGATIILNGQPISSINNNQPPVADAGAAQPVESAGATTAVTLNGSASSDPDGDPLTYAWAWTGGSATGVTPVVNLANGTYNITLTVDDGNGATATATTTITVQDTIAPTISIAPIPVTEATSVNGASVNVASYVTTSDVCAVSLAISPAGPYALGTSVVVATATDCAGNQSSASTRLTVVDTTAPVLTVPASVNLEANGVLSTVTLGSATATDVFATTVSNNAPATGFPLGTTTVIYTATDANSLTATGTQLVTVSDITAPVISLPAPVVVTATGLQTAVPLVAPLATDIFAPVTLTNNAPLTFPLGLTTVIWTATDANGNASTATQTVTVNVPNVALMTPAQITLLTPAQLALLSPLQIGGLTPLQLAAMTPAQLAVVGVSLAPLQIAALTPLQLAAILPTLTPVQIAALTPVQIAALTPLQLAGVFASLTPAQIAALTPIQVAALNPLQVAAIIANLTPMQAAVLTSAQVASLSKATLESLPEAMENIVENLLDDNEGDEEKDDEKKDEKSKKHDKDDD